MTSGLRPDTQTRGAVDVLPSWNSLDALPYQQGDNDLRVCPVSAAAIPRCVPSDITFSDILRNGVCSSILCPHEGNHQMMSATSSSTESLSPASSFTPEIQTEPHTFVFTFRPTPASALPVIVKRVRHRLDVDGPNTADLCCKKRRLRGELITSRLSQPYSQPATHILNREGQKQGDKRFVKMASSLEMARRLSQLQTTSFLRFSVMNRLRRRLGLGAPGQMAHSGDADDEGEGLVSEAQLDTTAKAPWRAQNSQVASRSKYVRPTTKDAGAIPSSRLSKPAALPLPPSDVAAAKRRTLSRIHPVRSPELQPERAAYYDELDDDGFANLYEDDEDADYGGGKAEHVYSDFGAIFGNGTPPADGDHSYEEYLDELDGISWVTM